MKTRAQVALTLMLYNIRPHSHTSIVPVERSYLLYYLIDGKEVDIARIISNEIKAIVESGTKPGSKPNYLLAFPRLITGLCKKAKVHIPNQVHEEIRGVVVERYTSRYCNLKPVEYHEEGEGVAPGSRLCFEEWMRTTITHSRDHSTSNYRVILYVQESLYYLQLQNGGPPEGEFQFMNPKAFQTHITWLEDRPIFSEGASTEEEHQ